MKEPCFHKVTQSVKADFAGSHKVHKDIATYRECKLLRNAFFWHIGM